MWTIRPQEMNLGLATAVPNTPEAKVHIVLYMKLNNKFKMHTLSKKMHYRAWQQRSATNARIHTFQDNAHTYVDSVTPEAKLGNTCS